MRHLVSIRDLTPEKVKELVDLALGPRENTHARPGEPVALIFLEASSRTRVSFELAAHSLEAKPVYVQSSGSSLEKDESLKDTVLIFRSMGIKVFVIRCKEEAQLAEVKQISGISIINAGDGTHEHPTQALLDLTTLRSLYSWKDLTGKTLAIVGDLRSSRVAQSWSLLAKMVGLSLRLVSPIEWRPTWGGEWPHFSDLDQGLANADIVMALRIQRERHSEADLKQQGELKKFQIGPESLGKDALLMHPGPVNWGVELDTSLQSHPRSLILLQVKYGVDLRRALLSQIFDSLPEKI